MKLKYIDKHFVVTGSVQEMVYQGGKDIPKGAGFRYRAEGEEPLPKFAIWYTDDPLIAATLINIATDKAKRILKELVAKQARALEASSATTSDFKVPAPDGEEYLPFQLAGIEYAMGRPNTLLGDEMGLGKTIEAIGVINCQGAIVKVLVVCNATLKLNWKIELDKWLVRTGYRVEVAYANQPFPRADVVITNYAMLTRVCKCIELNCRKKPCKNQCAGYPGPWDRSECPLHSKTWDILIVDECHKVKNNKALRSRAVKAVEAKTRLYLTGTPIVNRPVELWPLVSVLDPATFSDFFPFALRYCNARKNSYGKWDFGGASNLDELQDKLRASIMVRRLKKDVLSELPPKRRQVIEIPVNGSSAIIEAENKASAASEERLATLKVAVELAKASEDPEDYAEAVKALRKGWLVAFTEMAKVRHDTAVAKIPFVIDHLNSVLEAGNKVVVFAHHHDVLDALAEEFSKVAVKLDGRTNQKVRQENIERFQTDDKVRMFIGGIQAAGLGITLTAASHVVFAELDWVPGNVTQAEDRLHRIGQANSVLVQHLVLEGSIDANIAKTMVEKQAVIDKALDTAHPERFSATVEAEEPVIPVKSSTTSATKKAIHDEAKSLTRAQIEAVHAALKWLTSMDSDRATALNAAGFSKIDSDIGHSLAGAASLTPRQAALGKRIVLKYHRQLEPGLVAAVKGEK